MKKLIALLLALVMVLSLSACTRSDDDSKNEKEETTEQSAAPAPGDEQDEAQIDDSLRDFAEHYDDLGNELRTIDTGTLLAAIAPNLAHEALTEALELVYQIGVYSEDQFLSELDYAYPREVFLNNYGEDYLIETSMTDAEPLTDEQIVAVRKILSQLQDGYAELIKRGEEATQEEIQAAADRDGLTVDQELRLIELYRVILASLDGAEISEGYEVTLSNEITGSLYDGVDTREGHITVIKLNGEWMLVDGLIAFAVLHPISS